MVDVWSLGGCRVLHEFSFRRFVNIPLHFSRERAAKVGFRLSWKRWLQTFMKSFYHIMEVYDIAYREYFSAKILKNVFSMDRGTSSLSFGLIVRVIMKEMLGTDKMSLFYSTFPFGCIGQKCTRREKVQVSMNGWVYFVLPQKWNELFYSNFFLLLICNTECVLLRVLYFCSVWAFATVNIQIEWNSVKYKAVVSKILLTRSLSVSRMSVAAKFLFVIKLSLFYIFT